MTAICRTQRHTAQATFVALQVASQINTFLLAGYETTASALAFTVYHVAHNPDKEAKLLAEIDAFGRSRAPTLEDLDQVGNRAFAAAALRTGSPAGGLVAGSTALSGLLQMPCKDSCIMAFACSCHIWTQCLMRRCA